MKRFIYFSCIFALIAMHLSSCSEDMVGEEPSRVVCLNAYMPDKSNNTRASFDQNSESLNLIPKWETDDKIDLFIVQRNKVHSVPSVQVKNISNEGNTASFHFTLPSTVDINASYSIIGLFNIEGSADDNGNVSINAQLKRLSMSNPIMPLWFKVSGGPKSLDITLQHLGIYEILHIKNTNNVGIYFQHCGFDVTTPWYKFEDKMIVGKTDVPQSTSSENGEAKSRSYFVPGNGTMNILSWYMPSGEKMNKARLLAKIENKETKSINVKSSDVTFQCGRAYHMYVTWDGKELKFDNGDIVSSDLGVVVNNINGEDL